MSVLLQRLIDQLNRRGLSVKPGREPGQLLLAGPDREKTPEILDAVKAFKAELLEQFCRPPDGGEVDARPADAPVIDGHEVVRSGRCRALADGRLCWAHYRAGGWYWFEETLIPNGRQAVRSFRVFTSAGSGYATGEKFAAMFAEDRG